MDEPVDVCSGEAGGLMDSWSVAMRMEQMCDPWSSLRAREAPRGAVCASALRARVEFDPRGLVRVCVGARRECARGDRAYARLPCGAV